MLRKSISALVMLILFSLVLGPLGAANAQGPLPPASKMMDNRQGNHQYPAGARQDENGVWYMPAGGQSFKPESPSPLVTAGPDDFGYTWDDTVALNWVDVTGGVDTGLTGNGDGNATGAITIPFSFKYYENTYNQLYIAAPGYLSFTQAGYWEDQSFIPDLFEPNNVIAPYWTPDYIGAGSWVHYTSGGTAPNRYFVVEWHDVKGGYPPGTSGGDDTFRFETILYENGDIVFQYQAMAYSLGGHPCGAAGIEDSSGLDGLSYVNICNNAPSFKAVRFYRPLPMARVKLDLTEQGSFTTPGETKNLQINMRNTGELGSDTYDLIVASPWPVTLYAADGIAPLADTDTDGVIDTGPVPQEGTVTIVAKITVPIGANLGSANTATVTARSSLNISKSKAATLQSTVPAPFAQVYEDYIDRAMSIELVQTNAQTVKKVTLDGHNSYAMAMTTTPNGNFVYTWSKIRCLRGVPCNTNVVEIEYTLLDHSGNTVRAVSKLTDHSGAIMDTYDYQPSVAVAPDGTVSIVWFRRLYNVANQSNDNIYFATLDSMGNLTSGPTNLTNNTVWGTYSEPDIPRFDSPSIAASDDNRFILSWEEWTDYPSMNNIWYAIRDTTGVSVFPPTVLTNDNGSSYPILNSLTGGKTILTWNYYGSPTYAVLNSSGTIFKAATPLGVYVYATPDAVQLPNGKVAVAWPTYTGVQYAILNSSYAIEGGPFSANSPSFAYGDGLSVTTDPSSRVIMTWQDVTTSQKLLYALGDSAGSFLTQPMLYKASTTWLESSYNGQGNAQYISNIAAPVVVSSARADVDPTGASTVNFTVTFTQDVIGVDASDFSPVALGVLGSTVSGVSGSGSVYTVTVNTGSGSGSIRLNVLDDDSIVNAFANPIGGVGAGNGTFTFGETYTITKTWIFGDVTNTYWSWGFIERLYNAGITGGCSTIPLNYCPTTPVTRAQMAIFLLRGMHGSTYAPPAATGTKFTDVPLGTFGAAWIEQLAVEGITSGCGGGNYCPNTPVSRAQMAIFLVRAKHGIAFTPPTATGIFADVPVGSFGANYIEQLSADAITSGCGGSNFCPNTTVKRDSMAVFLVKTFNLP